MDPRSTLGASASTALRQAVPADLEAVRSCVDAAFGHYVERMGKPPGPMLLDHAAHIAQGHTWVLTNLDACSSAGPAAGVEQMLGVLVAYDTPEGYYVDTLAASPRAQGRGIGRALLDFAENEARRRGHAAVWLCTNAHMTENQSYYPHLGFAETGRGREDGFDRVYYRRPVTAP